MQVNRLCTPPALNDAASVVAHKSASGPGACAPLKLSNLDCTRARIVKRGCVVQLPSLPDNPITVRVAVVRLGFFVAETGPYHAWRKCSDVRVVS